MSRPSKSAPHNVDFKDATWRKSSYSGGANDCLEVAEFTGGVALRDSKDISLRPLLFSNSAMRSLVNGVTHGFIG
ncbi:DUF397 domain-containing protein [Streptomyces sp. NPDC006476]|uniref:DUF397 domain-containing protein n=1 Tax=Streptomyces sp. NPDC006476 TaxID=3157175 RepID=UPI0033A459F3